MNLKSKKFISLFLAFSLMMLSVNLYAKERRGAKLIITKKDGQLIEGELITVKPNSLLLLNTEGKDVSVGIADIKVIRVMKKSKALLGAGIGLVVGGGGGVLFPHAVNLAIGPAEGFGDPWEYSGMIGICTGVAGLLAGAIVGGLFGIDKTIHFEGMSDLEIEEAMDKLRKKARIRDYK